MMIIPFAHPMYYCRTRRRFTRRRTDISANWQKKRSQRLLQCKSGYLSVDGCNVPMATPSSRAYDGLSAGWSAYNQVLWMRRKTARLRGLENILRLAGTSKIREPERLRTFSIIRVSALQEYSSALYTSPPSFAQSNTPAPPAPTRSVCPYRGIFYPPPGSARL